MRSMYLMMTDISTHIMMGFFVFLHLCISAVTIELFFPKINKQINSKNMQKNYPKKLLFAIYIALFCVMQAYSDTGDKKESTYFTRLSSESVTPDEQGFIKRWTLLEPISKPNRSNSVFTDSYIRKTFNIEYFFDQFTVIPKDGQKVKVGKQKLTWH